MKIEILMSPGCGHGEQTGALLAEVVREHAPGANVETILVETLEEAARRGFPGSPTVRVNGKDIEREAPTNVGLA